MDQHDDASPPQTYPLRTAARLTGLSPELLRAWERRYRVVEPQRTSGGTRRYTAAELDRLRLLKAAVDAGHRISQVAGLDDDALRKRASRTELGNTEQLGEILAAIDALDAVETNRVLSVYFSSLGPLRFARQIAVPLAREIGERWARREIGVASEHLATATIRSLLGNALQPSAQAQLGPRILFATLSGEPHELGLQTAALTAMGAGANPLYLGTEVPTDEIQRAAARSQARAVALSVVTLDPAEAAGALETLRTGLKNEVLIWLGGAGAAKVPPLAGVEHVSSLDDLEQRVALLGA